MADYSNDFNIAYDPRAQSCSISFRSFDTPNSITVYGCSQPDFVVEGLLLEMRKLCLDYHRLWSFTLEGSDVSRINAAEDRVRVDPRTVRLLEAMQRFHEQEPSFDFTVGPVSYLWKHAEHLPSDDEITALLAHVGVEKVTLSGNEVVKADPMVKVDVGGAAKGFIADELAERLRVAGVQSADIDLGGNLFMLGSHPAGRPWRVSVRIPEGVSAKPPVLEVRDESVVTSGSYERFIELQGKRYQHIVDARTGLPVQGDIVSVTVACKSSLQADMLATTALVERLCGFASLVARHPEARFVVISQSGDVLQTV